MRDRLEIEAYNFYKQKFELVAEPGRRRFRDRVETVSLAGDLTRFITPGSGSMIARVKYVSPNIDQQFTANMDHIFWTIIE